MKLKEFLNTTLYEEEKENKKQEKILKKNEFALKLFYNFDVFMKKNVGEDVDNQKEQILKSSGNGLERVPVSKSLNIQTAEELIDLIDDLKILDVGANTKINPIIEILKAIVENPFDPDVAQVLSKDDKMIVDVDFGEERDSSVGFKVNKVKGVEAFSVMMKKNGAILPNKFQKDIIDRQLLYYRNRASEEIK